MSEFNRNIFTDSRSSKLEKVADYLLAIIILSQFVLKASTIIGFSLTMAALAYFDVLTK